MSIHQEKRYLTYWISTDLNGVGEKLPDMKASDQIRQNNKKTMFV